MNKQPISESADKSSIGRHRPLDALIQTLHQMMIAVSARLRYMHFRDRRQMEHAKGSYDIWAKIGSHLEQIHGEDVDDAVVPSAVQPQSASASGRSNGPYAAGGQSSALSKHYTHRTIVGHHPHMDEVMRKRTVEHVHTALQLARKGDQGSAKLHVELAESAMQTASRFMSQDDYEAFEREVEHRLETLLAGTPDAEKKGDA